MHHVHLLVCSGEDFDDAQNKISATIEEWGTENNWFNVEGGFDDKGIRYEKTQSGFMDMFKTLEELNDHVQEWMSEYGDDDKREIVNLLKNAIEEKDMSGHEWWRIKKYADHMYNVKYSDPGEPFNVFKHEFRAHQFEECGVTHLNDKANKGEKLFVVSVDIHT